MGRIINEKNVKIIVDGLELLKKQLEVLTPVRIHSIEFQHTTYSLSDVQSLLDVLSETKDLDE